MKANRLIVATLVITLVATAMPATSSASTEPVSATAIELQGRPIPAQPMAVLLQSAPATHFTRAVVQAQTPGPTTRMPGGHFSRKALLVTAVVVTALIVTLYIVVPRS